MSDEITLHGDIRDLRALTGALATLLLRKRGALDANGKLALPVKHLIPFGDRVHRPWTDAELKYAKDLRSRGFSYRNIGKAVCRPIASIHVKIGPGAQHATA